MRKIAGGGGGLKENTTKPRTCRNPDTKKQIHSTENTSTTGFLQNL